MFWTDSAGHVWQASLSDGSNATTIMSGFNKPREFINHCVSTSLFTSFFCSCHCVFVVVVFTLEQMIWHWIGSTIISLFRIWLDRP